ncbi:MAG: PAS domain-containing protein, partial [Ectothiorhodospiraceae bacterium]|nr:PAS domain-containing protein [Ectothiorhodospiraceae bacterium]
MTSKLAPFGRQSGSPETQRNEALADLQAVVQEAGDLIASFDLQEGLIALNPAGLRMLGLASLEQVRQGHWSSVVASDSLSVLREQGLAHAVRHGLWRGMLTLLDRDGGTLEVEFIIIATRSGNGGLRGFNVVGRDRTSDRRKERLIREREQRLE